MNLKEITKISKSISNTKTKYFVKGKFKGKIFYVNSFCEATNKPFYFNSKDEAIESSNKFSYHYFIKLALFKKIKIYQKTEPEIYWKKLGF